MANFIPFGRLPDGKYGILLQDGTKTPLASAIEVLNGIPAIADSRNYPGRIIFDTVTNRAYAFANSPTPVWQPLQGSLAQIGSAHGAPPVSPTPTVGSLYWDIDTQVLFLWDGTKWTSTTGAANPGILYQKYVGDGSTLSFAIGRDSTLSPTWVEVYVDGVHQVPGSGASGDYQVVGSNVVFGSAPPFGTKISMVVFSKMLLLRQAQINRSRYIATVGQTTFSTGAFHVDPASTFVFVNGFVKSLNLDYTVTSQNTVITSITSSPFVNPAPYNTVARVTFQAAHNMVVGSTFNIFGSTQGGANFFDPLNPTQTFLGLNYVVVNVVNPTTVDVYYPSLNPATFTPNPVLYYYPATTLDQIVFNAPLNAGDQVDIRCVTNAVTAAPIGEANIIRSIGSGISLAAGKSGVTLLTKSLKAGPNITLASTSTDITISSASAVSFEDRVSVNGSYYLINGNESYVGVRNTTTAVTIDLTSVTLNPQNSGRRIVIKDESGLARTNPITLFPGTGRIDGDTNYVINTNFGAVTIVCDGLGWNIVSKKV